MRVGAVALHAHHAAGGIHHLRHRDRLGQELGGSRRERAVAGFLGVDAREHDHLGPGGAAGAHARLDRHGLFELEVDEDELGGEGGAVHQLQPRRGREHDIEIAGVLPDPAAEAVEKHLVVVEQGKTHASWRDRPAMLVLVRSGGPRRGCRGVISDAHGASLGEWGTNSREACLEAEPSPRRACLSTRASASAREAAVLEGCTLHVRIGQEPVEPGRQPPGRTPERCMSAGIRSSRTTKASNSTPTARPNPSGRTIASVGEDEPAEDRDHDDRGRDDHRASVAERRPSPRCAAGLPCTKASRMPDTEEELVVHREAEENADQDDRGEVEHRARVVHAEDLAEPAPLVDRRDGTEGGERARAGSRPSRSAARAATGTPGS